jgi:hypothetical protein
MEDDADEQFSNTFFGDAEKVVQAHNIHGDVNIHSGSVAYESDDYPLVTGTVYRGAGVFFFLALFILGATYARLVGATDLTFWSWVKLTISSVVLIGVLVRTEWAIFSDLFSSIRRLGMLVFVILGIAQGSQSEFLGKFTTLLGHWLVWSF